MASAKTSDDDTVSLLLPIQKVAQGGQPEFRMAIQAEGPRPRPARRGGTPGAESGTHGGRKTSTLRGLTPGRQLARSQSPRLTPRHWCTLGLKGSSASQAEDAKESQRLVGGCTDLPSTSGSRDRRLTRSGVGGALRAPKPSSRRTPTKFLRTPSRRPVRPRRPENDIFCLSMPCCLAWSDFCP